MTARLAAADLQGFLASHQADHPEQVLHIHAPVDAKFQVTAIVAQLERQKRFPTLVFHKVLVDGQPSEFPLVVSLTSRTTGDVVCKHTYHINAGDGTPLTFRSWSPFPPTSAAARDTYDLHVTLFPPDGKPPSLDADDENGIRGSQSERAPLPIDLC